MRRVAWCACAVGLAALAGCVSQAKYDALLAQNEIQSATIKDLERDLDHARTDGADGADGADPARPLTRPQRLLCASLAEEEQVLADLSGKALQIIIEDGTTVVFPTIVRQLGEDLQASGGFLAREKTGPYTRQLHRQITQTLEELIEALQRAQKIQQGKSQQAQSQPGEQPQPPLVPESAELKLLRSAQFRVNRQTAGFDKARPQGPLDPPMHVEVQRIRDRQEQVRRMAEDMYDLDARSEPADPGR